MGSFVLGVKLLPLLFSALLHVDPSAGFPPEPSALHAQVSTYPGQEVQAPRRVNTVRLVCHPDSLEVVVQADMFGLGAPVDGEELRLGVYQDDFCRAQEASGGREFRILVGLLDCGTKSWMTDNALVYTNLLIYSPVTSSEGVIRMDEAVIPVECHYERRYSLSSSSLTPTWLPFTSTQAAAETLVFDLKVMTDDWLYERSSQVFHLGEPISVEASVRVGHHPGLRVFVSSCLATLTPDVRSEPSYLFIENGCLIDSQLPGSGSQFLPRLQDDKLRFTIDAFRFHEEDKGELYLSCHLTAGPVEEAAAPSKACSLLNGRWRSADGNDYLCGYCQNDIGQTFGLSSISAKYGPRGFGTPTQELFWRSALRTNKIWDQEAVIGPMLVLPAEEKSPPIPAEELPSILHKISRPTLYGSQWKSGLKKDMTGPERLPEAAAAPGQTSEDDDLHADLNKGEATPQEEGVSVETNSTAVLEDLAPEPEVTVETPTAEDADSGDQ